MPELQKTSICYSLLQIWVKLGLNIYFRDIQVVGKENVPRNAPVLFAVNHPNTVLDALLTTCFGPRRPWFMTRGDVFNNKFLARIFRVMRMLPIYRERDGATQVKNNAEVFSLCSRILAKGGSVIMFPEGSHNREWRIRDLRRGLARIAQDSVQLNPELLVVPVGLTYFDPALPFSDVLIQFGEPIKAADFFKGSEHSLAQQNAFMKEVGTRLEELTLHIGESDYQDIYERVKYLELHEEGSATLLEDFTRLQGWIDSCKKDPKLGREPENKLLNAVKRKTFPLVALIVTIPFWLVGKVFTIIPQLLIKLVLGKIKDDHFTAAVKFGMGLILYTLIFIGIGVWCYLTTLTILWLLIKLAFFTFCLFFVMLWEEHFENFRNKRFTPS